MKRNSNQSIYNIFCSAVYIGMLICAFYVTIWYIINPFISNFLKDYLPSVSTLIKETIGYGKIARFASYLTLMLLILGLGIQLSQKTKVYRKEWIPYLFPLASFLILSGISIQWSVMPNITRTRFLFFFVSTMVGIFVGFKYKDKTILKIFSVFFGIVITTSIITALFLSYGVQAKVFGFSRNFMAWRGIFNYKNTFGSFMAFGNILYLYLSVTCQCQSFWKRWYYYTFYAITLVLIYLSSSAGSVITWAVVTAFFLISFMFIKWGHLIKPVHWVLIGIALFGVAIASWIFWGDLLSLLGKESTLTLRVPNWQIALKDVIPARPYFGYGGFGAFWESDLIKVYAKSFQSVPNHAHNGYVEILISFGIFGAILFMITYLENIILGIKTLLKERSISTIWPILFFLHFAVVNIVYSLIGRLESFFWFVFVITLAYNIRVTFDPEQETDAETTPVLS